MINNLKKEVQHLQRMITIFYFYSTFKIKNVLSNSKFNVSVCIMKNCIKKLQIYLPLIASLHI